MHVSFPAWDPSSKLAQRVRDFVANGNTLILAGRTLSKEFLNRYFYMHIREVTGGYNHGPWYKAMGIDSQFEYSPRVAGIPPTSTSMFNSICYELVAELADGIPDIADGVRKKLDLPPKHLEFKEKAERDLVYTTAHLG
ncbi:hypothetical protein GUITHDRAFT_145594 [Guillardia theta CCMP2712]|uniref:Uncharacterized protein n=1 Tax=Guillardia theta (strain CCMP2712) TaxID=905079 RepID=L1IKI3_GUITC|nr:hypothetical protein GUITHDRAFT_145594 [Guillardia theta CCMP2712]EKX36637.1 hypothetical protein GUITHDRAFT_145594 [Guillardia theta CCMP2712]|eukprot:XP_005823617.1 hypothetical protein GUITHDRAFT_145594 [Guillardia theta CCMP2712]